MTQKGRTINARANTCPLCGGDGRFVFARHGYAIHDCARCGHRFCPIEDPNDHVRRTYGDAYFTGGAAGYSGFDAEAALNVARGAAYARAVAPWIRSGRLLDVGAAAGHVLKGWIDAGWSGVGLEPNATACAVANDRLGVDVRRSTLETWQPDDELAFDLVSLVQVLPHFVDVHGAVDAAIAHLRPGGWLLVEAWDRSSWLAKTMGRRWHEYAPPSVLHWFRPNDVRALMARHGLVLVSRGQPRRRIRVDHARAVVRHALSGSFLKPIAGPLALLPGGMTVPYPGHDLFWMLFRGR